MPGSFPQVMHTQPSGATSSWKPPQMPQLSWEVTLCPQTLYLYVFSPSLSPVAHAVCLSQQLTWVWQTRVSP